MGEILGQIITLVGSLAAVALSGYAVYKGNVKAKRIESEAAPYAAMSAHVVTLTKEVEGLRAQVSTLTSATWLMQGERWTDRTFIQKMATGWGDRPLPQPMPQWLSEHYGLPLMHPQTPGSIIQPPII